MDIKEVAQHLWPCWLAGLMMLYMVMNSKYKDILKVDKKGLLRFAGWMAVITIFRFIVFKFLAPDELLGQVREMVNFIPWPTTFGVFWEDMCHTVPLVIASRMFKNREWYKWMKWPMLITVMVSFGLGHLYQGLAPSIGLAFYIPITMRLGKKYGFGTVMLCHMFYDLMTLLTLKWMVGA